MKIEVFLSPREVPEHYAKGRRIVLVDVLRACTCVTLALESGAERIVPTESIEGAKQLLSLLDRKGTLLAGEKDGAKVPGFDLGNSPAEFRDPAVTGKTIVFTSDSGAPLMARGFGESEKPLLSFINLSAAAQYLTAAKDEEITILCAGQEGRFSLEDAVCAGMLCHTLTHRKPPAELNDAAWAALLLYRLHREDLFGLVCRSVTGAFLCGQGLEADVEEATRVDSVSMVAVVREGRVVAARAPAPR